MTHRALAAAALVLGILAAFAGSPDPQHATDVHQLAMQVEREEDHVTALELAAWIKERKPEVRIIDLRTAEEFDRYHVPLSESMSIAKLLDAHFAKRETIVLISDGGAHAAQAWVFLRTLGHERVYFLRGGLGEWMDEVMHPKTTSELTRYFGATARGEEAASDDEIARMRRRGC